MKNPPLIGTGTLNQNSLAGKVAIVTGSGKGIGFEAARALVWLGCTIFVAEIDRIAGKEAAQKINEEAGEEKAIFLRTDIGNEGDVEHLKFESLRRFGKVDVVLNNATLAPIGPVKDVLIKDWDRSYRVNLRGPVLLARAFLPEMINQNYGVFVCVSSFGGAFMSACESFKRAQVVLVDAIAEELEGTGVIAFTLGPGQVRTQTMEESIRQLAPLYGKTPEEFIAINQNSLISIEAAGAGFASAVALAPQFRGLETTSLQALQAAGITMMGVTGDDTTPGLTTEQIDEAATLCQEVIKTLFEQSEGWKKRPLFERRWVINDFNRSTGLPVEKWLEQLDKLGQTLKSRDSHSRRISEVAVIKIAHYWKHQADLSRSYAKNPDELKKQLEILGEWENTAERLSRLILR